MVACRITDSRNGGQPPGVSQVPLKKHRQGRVPGLTSLVDAARGLLSVLGLGLGLGSSRASSVVVGVGGLDVDEVDGPPGLGPGLGLARIHRAPDGRFVLGASNRSSVSSTSDDGGFLSRGVAALTASVGGAVAARASWRRPLVRCPSNLSLRSDGSGESVAPRHPRHLVLTTAIVHPAHAHHHYANQRTLARTLGRPAVSAIYSPSASAPAAAARRAPRVVASSPTAVAWSPVLNFSDLSSVRTPPGHLAPSYQQLRSVHERYAQELPSLTAIHEQQQQLMMLQRRPRPRPRPQPQPQPQPRHVFLPIPALTPSPRAGPDPPSRTTTAAASPWTAWAPHRHVRHARSAPDLSVRTPNTSGVDASPESRSSSSGFGSKNTSSQPNQSGSQPGSSPPYRPPPAPPLPAPATPSTSRLGLGLSEWLGITAGLPQRPSPSPYQDKQGCDVSVDGHYEFDAVFVGTPTRDERGLSDSETTYPTVLDDDLDASPTSDSLTRRKHDNIEARVQAMKEEFAAFRERQARRRRSPQLESVC